MAKNKKKQSPHEANKLAAAHHRNEFLRKIQEILTILGKDKLLAKIPKINLDAMYRFRAHKPRLILKEGHKVNDKYWEALTFFFNVFLKKTKIYIPALKTEVSVEDLLLYFFPLYSYPILFKEEKNAYIKEMIEAINPIFEVKNCLQEVQTKLENFGTVLNFGFTSHAQYLIGLTINLDKAVHSEINYSIYLEISALKPEKITVNVKNTPRPAAKLYASTVNNDFYELKVKPSDFGIGSTFGDINLNIYIQSHALQRLYERLDNVSLGIIDLCLAHSIRNVKYKALGNNRFLVDYYILSDKVGYLIIDFIEGIFLIRTFLFLTNNSTPEGEKLNKMLNIEKLDKEYLAIDKLSTFSNEKFVKNEKLKEIFTNAGCLSLYNYVPINLSGKSKDNINPEAILKYLEQIKPEQETNNFSLIDEQEEKEEISEKLEVRSLK